MGRNARLVHPVVVLWVVLRTTRGVLLVLLLLVVVVVAVVVCVGRGTRPNKNPPQRGTACHRAPWLRQSLTGQLLQPLVCPDEQTRHVRFRELGLHQTTHTYET